MKVFYELDLHNFEAWSGGKDTLNTILENNKGNDFDALIEELYPDGIDETVLNDLLWFEPEWIFESLGINENEEEDENEEAEEIEIENQF